MHRIALTLRSWRLHWRWRGQRLSWQYPAPKSTLAASQRLAMQKWPKSGIYVTSTVLGSMWILVSLQSAMRRRAPLLTLPAFGLLARALATDEFSQIISATEGMELVDSITGDGHKLLNVVSHPHPVSLPFQPPSLTSSIKAIRLRLLFQPPPANRTRHLPERERRVPERRRSRQRLLGPFSAQHRHRELAPFPRSARLRQPRRLRTRGLPRDAGEADTALSRYRRPHS